MAAYDPAQVRAAQVTPRFSVLARTGLDVAALGTWDANLLHEPRVLVPVDVQAYVVPAAGAEPALALPGPLSPGHGSDPAVVDGPPPFTAGAPRPAGIHLSWAMPDALQRGRLQDPRQGSGGGLGMGALPDLWAVLRVLAAAAPAAGTPPTAIRGWLLDAAAGAARDLATGAAGAPLPQDPARQLGPDELTGTAGGSLTWTGELRRGLLPVRLARPARRPDRRPAARRDAAGRGVRRHRHLRRSRLVLHRRPRPAGRRPHHRQPGRAARRARLAADHRRR